MCQSLRFGNPMYKLFQPLSPLRQIFQPVSRRQAEAKAWFLWCLPVAPVLFTVIVLGVTYL